MLSPYLVNWNLSSRLHFLPAKVQWCWQFWSHYLAFLCKHQFSMLVSTYFSIIFYQTYFMKPATMTGTKHYLGQGAEFSIILKIHPFNELDCRGLCNWFSSFHSQRYLFDLGEAVSFKPSFLAFWLKTQYIFPPSVWQPSERAIQPISSIISPEVSFHLLVWEVSILKECSPGWQLYQGHYYSIVSEVWSQWQQRRMKRLPKYPDPRRDHTHNKLLLWSSMGIGWDQSEAGFVHTKQVQTCRGE